MKLFSCDCADRIAALVNRCERLEASRKAQAMEFTDLQDKVYGWMKKIQQRERAAATATLREETEPGQVAAGPVSPAVARILARRNRGFNGVPSGVPGEG